MISIIVPVYNAEQYLHRCIDSILAQSYTDFELLLIDDGSPDKCGAICDEYAIKDSRVRVFHKENGGVSSARNLGLIHALGEYVTFCDSDDEVTSDWLEVYEIAIKKNLDIAMQGILLIGEFGNQSKKMPSQIGCTVEEKRTLVVELMNHGLFGYTVVKLFRKSIIDQYCIRFDEQSNLWEDGQFIAKYLQYIVSFACIENVGYFYYCPPKGKNYNGNLGYSVYHMLKSFDVIFDQNIPQTFLSLFYGILKDYMVMKIVKGCKLDADCFDFYGRMAIIMGEDKKLIHYLIQHSRSCNLSKKILKIVHRLLS